MNLKSWLVGMISSNRTVAESDVATTVGIEDGREMTRAYVHGFRRGMTEVLTEEMRGFHQVIEVTPVTKQTSKRLPKQS